MKYCMLQNASIICHPGKMIAWEQPDFDFDTGRTYLFPGLQGSN
jgi:hypothetical protein